VLVNNAGFAVYGKSLDQDYTSIAAMVEVLVTAVTALTHLFGKDMKDAGYGRILQVASVGAFQPSPLYAVYSAAKAYVLSMSVAMNRELSRSDVSITTVCPGLTETEFHAVAGHLKPESLDWTQMTPRQVAEAGLDAMMKGRDVVTPGWPNKIAGGFAKMLPRSWVTTVAGNSMRARRKGS
jgi:hypothetical protein